jgi:uncharacterized protein (TIGR00299 family) protein
MLTAALYELLPESGRTAFLQKMESLGLPGVRIVPEPSEKCGIHGTHIRVFVGDREEHSHDSFSENADLQPSAAAQGTRSLSVHTHTQDEAEIYGYKAIRGLIENLKLSERVRRDAVSVYRIIADAEAAVHGGDTESVHFHELGSLDAVADVVGVCLLVEMLSVKEITASAVHVGSGFVRCAHGIVPVPAPATALILQGVPIFSRRIKGELTTPTGAALLKHFVSRFGDMEELSYTAVGYGMGSKDFEIANCVRAYLCGDTDDPHDRILEISCNLDDMTGEAIGAACETLLSRGALDVFTSPIYMKKNRPATLLTVLCKQEDREKFTKLLLTHTTTFGVRVKECSRDKLDVSFETVPTSYGEIRLKTGRGYGIEKSKPEHDDIIKAADTAGVTYAEVQKEVENQCKK